MENLKDYIISYNNGVYSAISSVDRCNKGEGEIIYRGEYNKYYLVIVSASDIKDAVHKAEKIVSADICENGRKQLLFPEFRSRTDTQKMVWAASKARDEFIREHLERFNELADKLNPCDKWNWGALLDAKVTSQEYVVMFSDSAGDMFARGICKKYYDGEWNEEQYGDSFN